MIDLQSQFLEYDFDLVKSDHRRKLLRSARRSLATSRLFRRSQQLAGFNLLPPISLLDALYFLISFFFFMSER